MQTGFGVSQEPYKFGIGGSFPGVKRLGLQAYSYIILCLGCILYGATPALPHLAWCLINYRKMYRYFPIK